MTSLDFNFNLINYQNYLKKYSSDYRIKRDTDGIYQIICKKGTIKPYNPSKNLLTYCCFFDTSRQKFYFLDKKPDELLISQDADTDISLIFDESNLSNLTHYLGIYLKKRNYSAEALERLRENIAKVRQKRG